MGKIKHKNRTKQMTPKEAVLAYWKFAWKNGTRLVDCEKWIEENL